jgi:hypothetical protein
VSKIEGVPVLCNFQCYQRSKRTMDAIYTYHHCATTYIGRMDKKKGREKLLDRARALGTDHSVKVAFDFA